MDTSETYKKLPDNASPLEPIDKVELVKWYEDPIYIKMCDCPEIQRGHNWQDGDLYYDNNLSEGHLKLYMWSLREVSEGGAFEDSDGKYIKRVIWLPRQDQLQEMLVIDNVPLMSVAWVGYLLCLLQYNIGLECTSMEQLWLAFVMREKYGKVWTGEGWQIKEVQ